MDESYVLLWPLDRLRWLKRVKDDGPFEVVFGGPHISQPSIERLAVGSRVYPLAVMKGGLHVLARLTVQELLDPVEYVKRRLGIGVDDLSWTMFRDGLPDKGAAVGHRAPWTCADLAACGEGTPFAWDRVVPAGELENLRFGPKSGRETPLKGISGGVIANGFSLHGHLRRASVQTAGILERVVAGTDA